ncbi:MAG: hypothetical protein B7Z51_11030 [Methyloversatilis sp. 12-65-5]|nr:MAG: hypothetical protein B7Z51_11030 [Methyloversatilis sp. 12-65-5]
MTTDHNRRRILKASAGLMMPGVFGTIARAAAAAEAEDRILVVFEMSGGNDGLNTVVPYADDRYYRLRPKIGIRPDKVRKLDDRFGLNPGMAGFERLWKDGRLAIVHGCGYDNPSFSHFTSMAYLHTATPNSGDDYGWVGRLADAMSPAPVPNYLLNIDTAQSLAVRSRVHTPVVFDEPDRFVRSALHPTRALLDDVAVASTDNPSRRYLEQVAVSARESSLAVYTSDSIHGFLRDMERIGQADRVSLLIFSEFGRRVPENTSLGTDHGTANVMFFAGRQVKGGHYGTPSDLGALDAGDNLIHTTDFRSVYASAIDGWLKVGAADTILKGRFAPLPVFG